MSSIGFVIFPAGTEVSSVILEGCAANFNNNYGIWQDKSNGRVKMPRKTLAKNYLGDKHCRLAIAFIGNFENVIGHVFCRTFYVDNIEKDVTWVTQLVVNSHYRHQKIAQNLVHAVLGTTCECVALATSHPYAVRAVEKAVGSKASRAITMAVAAEIVSSSGVAYLKEKALVFSHGRCLINTQFFVDHGEPQAALDALSNAWHLGPLMEGHEFVAVILT